jgi:antitoxin ParD1/3/4
MSTLTVSLPDDLQAWIEAEARANGLSGPGQFVGKVMHEARARREREREEELEKLLIEGVESGEPQPVDEPWWATVRAAVKARAKTDAGPDATAR